MFKFLAERKKSGAPEKRMGMRKQQKISGSEEETNEKKMRRKQSHNRKTKTSMEK